jgi:hypothetical protein
MRMANLWGWSRVTEDEYRANLTGMNTFFGAVLGFVLADIPTEKLFDFAHMLVLTAAIVISILYISASPKRWFYAAMTLLLIWGMPRLLEQEGEEIGRLQVTLAVWTILSTLVEAWWAWQNRQDAKANRTAA